MEYYEKDGKIGVLVSPEYGAGWSTWNNAELAYDKRVVEFWLSHKDDKEFMETVGSDGYYCGESKAYKEAARFFKSIGYEKCPYMGGFSTIVLMFVPRGIPWRISEDDGAEELETLEDLESNGFTTF
jgi:hypothetical protein